LPQTIEVITAPSAAAQASRALPQLEPDLRPDALAIPVGTKCIGVQPTSRRPLTCSGVQPSVRPNLCCRSTHCSRGGYSGP